jgi:hypothetical protein
VEETKSPDTMIDDSIKILKDNKIKFKSNLIYINKLFNNEVQKIPWSSACKIYGHIVDHIKTIVVSDIIMSYLQ